jgi:Rrf2 family protein
MLYSTNTQYAIRALAALAVRAGEQGMMLDQVVAGTTLPREFIGKIFQSLVKGGILISTRGRGGGFALARPPYRISLLDIVRAVEGNGVCDQCVLGLPTCSDQTPCPQHDLYKPIRQRLRDYLNTTSLADMVSSTKVAGGEIPNCVGNEIPKLKSQISNKSQNGK